MPLPPPSYKPKPPTYPPAYFEIHRGPQGLHWILWQDQAKARACLTGHCGLNPKTREGAVQAIEDFKKLVAAAVIKPENP